MFKNASKVLAHVSSMEGGNFVTPQYILNKGNDKVNLFRRYCPHRMYPMETPGTNVGEITCKFHNFKWSAVGEPLNNDKKLGCGSAATGRSGLVFKGFTEPDHQWVEDLANETGLEYSHSYQGKSTGSWLWMMEVQTDLLHLSLDGIHPIFSKMIDLSTVTLEQGNGWMLQRHPAGWWLCIYPYTFIEWSPGCLGINYAIPTDDKKEYGFEWITQFYYDPSISQDSRKGFEILEDVFKEDVEAIEKIKSDYFPLVKTVSYLEDHCVHFGKWVQENLEVSKLNNSS
jgi:hypothetical protein